MWPTTTDYSNRQIDLEIMQTIVKPANITMLSLSLTEHSLKAVTGMQKLAQRFAITFLTQLNDVHFDPTYGTVFWANIIQGSGQNRGQLNRAIASANASAVFIMNNEDVDSRFGTVPPDEQIVDATMVDLVIDATSGTIYIRTRLTNLAGDDYVYVLPVSLSGSQA